MDDKKKISGKKSNVKVNPRSEEIMERRTKIAQDLFGTKLESMKIQDDFDHFAADHFTDEELLEICEEVLSEIDAEELDDICEAIEDNLDVISERMDPKEVQRRRDQAKDRLATGAAMKRAAEKSSSKSSDADAKPSRAERVKSALKKAASTAKKVAVKAGRAAGEVAGAARAGYRDASSSSSSGSSSGSSSSSSSGSSSSSSSGGSSSGSGENRVRLRDRLKSAIKKGVGKLARSVSRGARNVARRMGEETVISFSAFVSEAKDEDGFAGAATSYKGVVIRRTKSGYECPRFNLESNSLDSIKQSIDKEIAKVDEETRPEFAGNYDGPLYAPWTAVEEGKKSKCSKCGGEGCKHCDGKGYHAESAVPGKPAERLGAVTAIPKDEQDAAKARLLAKTAAKRKEREMAKEEFEIEEGMTMKDFKANRKKNERKAATADARKRGHEGSEWHNTGRTYSPDEAKSRRANMSDDDRAARKRAAIDPDDDRDENTYSADKTKNPKKQRKQAAMGEAMSFSQFLESCGCGSAAKKKTAKVAATPMATEETINERGDFWHPDPEKDKKLGGPGANQRAREDRADAAKPKKDYSKTTKPGESYMDFHKRKQAEKKSAYKSSGSTPRERLEKMGAKLPPKKEGLRDKIKRKLGLKNSFEPEGNLVDEARRGPAAPGKAERGAAAAASLAAKRKRQEVLDKHEKKTGTKLDISKSPEGKAHAKNFPGSRQAPKVKGAKETPSETHNRRVNRNVERIVKHGYTSKEKKEVQSMAKHTSRYD